MHECIPEEDDGDDIACTGVGGDGGDDGGAGWIYGDDGAGGWVWGWRGMEARAEDSDERMGDKSTSSTVPPAEGVPPLDAPPYIPPLYVGM